MDFYGFYTGKEFEAYRFLGAHPDDTGTTFRTFAPSASSVSVIGDFNQWTDTPMQKIYDGNFWECQIPQAARGMRYKYRIYDRNGRFIDHCDPYAFYSELRPGTCSVIYGLSFSHDFNVHRKSRWNHSLQSPINIYELHAGSWRRTEEGFYDWNRLADELIPYLHRENYNYLELMPLAEYPCDESWGYQPTGFFSPTSRYGDPDCLHTFIRRCHEAGIGIILDFVPVHFAVNDYALANYDGTSLYEYPNTDVGYSEWGSCNFMHSRGEVRSFLQSSAFYWLNEFHFDGLRVDAVSNLIYWQGNASRGTNQNALQFLRNMNAGLKERLPHALLIAEDSTVYPGVTRPVHEGGLGFDLKWDLGWMNDTLRYMQATPEERSRHPERLSFSMHYFYNENYLMALSHDEVVHGKASILQKMNGNDYDNKFAQVRLLYMYMAAHPGKKLNFMGNEFGMFREWNEQTELDWNLFDYPKHRMLADFMRKLNGYCLFEPAFFEKDYDPEGFSWADCHAGSNAVFAFIRHSSDHSVLIVLNFSDTQQNDCQIRTDNGCYARLIMDSSWTCFGGNSAQEELCLSKQDDRFHIQISSFCGQYYMLS